MIDQNITIWKNIQKLPKLRNADKKRIRCRASPPVFSGGCGEKSIFLNTTFLTQNKIFCGIVISQLNIKVSQVINLSIINKNKNMKYEYKILVPELTGFLKNKMSPSMEVELNTLGEEGWELVAVTALLLTTSVGFGGTKSNLVYYFKRLKK